MNVNGLSPEETPGDHSSKEQAHQTVEGQRYKHSVVIALVYRHSHFFSMGAVIVLIQSYSYVVPGQVSWVCILYKF